MQLCLLASHPIGRRLKRFSKGFSKACQRPLRNFRMTFERPFGRSLKNTSNGCERFVKLLPKVFDNASQGLSKASAAFQTLSKGIQRPLRGHSKAFFKVTEKEGQAGQGVAAPQGRPGAPGGLTSATGEPC